MTIDDFDRDTVDEYVLLAEEDNHILGFASLYLPDNFIHNLFVHPDFFCKGIGGLLLDASIAQMNPRTIEVRLRKSQRDEVL